MALEVGCGGPKSGRIFLHQGEANVAGVAEQVSNYAGRMIMVNRESLRWATTSYSIKPQLRLRSPADGAKAALISLHLLCLLQRKTVTF